MKIESLKFEEVTLMQEGHEPILFNADFEFPMNQIIWMQAEEGAGKSTVLQALAGLKIPQSGKFFINGENVIDMSFEEFLPYRLQIGYTFDYGGLISNRSLFDNLMLPLLYHKIVTAEEAKELVRQIMTDFGVLELAQQRPAMVPGRVRKIAILMRSLILKPQMLILDDPSVGLSQESVHVFVDYIHKLRKDGHLRHLFISSYDEKFMNLFEHQIIHLNDGQLYFQTVDPEKRVVHL